MTTQTDLSVTVITVAYNSMAVLPSMVASVPKNIPIIVVDNGSSDTSDLQALAQERDIDLVLNTENKGFGVACNLGAERATTEYLLFLNPDAELQANALDELFKAARTYPDASAFNPRISSASGKPSFKRKSHLIPRSEWMPRGWPKQDTEVSVLSGAAIFVSKVAFDAVDGFDPNIFLYYEDDDLSQRLRKIGPLMFVRDAEVTHLSGHSTVRSPASAAFKARHMAHSRVYATGKHGRSFPFARALASALWQLLSLHVLVSKRKRAKQIAYLKGVLDMWDNSGKPVTEIQHQND